MSLSVLDSCVLVVLPVLSVWFVLSGLDDLIVDLIFAAMKCFKSIPSPLVLEALPEKKLAVLVPLWKEYEVIEKMLEHNLSVIQYHNYEFFVGVYPNDTETLKAVRAAVKTVPRVHLCLCPHDGPTSKADCLNWVMQHIILHEQRTSQTYDGFLMHDAEDVIHPRAFPLINQLLENHDMVQVPVLPLPTPFWSLTHAVYCDEFAEGQIKDLRARVFAGGFLPSCGVGTALSRHCVQRLSETQSNRVFEPTCLTEDYEMGMRVHRLGLKQIHSDLGPRPIATREFFPQTFRGAVRQRTRWITGISLQGWQRNGWGKDWKSYYWLWRDRKGLIGNLLSVTANILFVYGILTYAFCAMTGMPWGLSSGVPGLAWLALLFQLIRLATRTVCCSLIYGPLFAMGTPIRVAWANVINFYATLSAIKRFTIATFTKTPLVWLKTEHAFPSIAVLEEAAAMGEQKVRSAGAT